MNTITKQLPAELYAQLPQLLQQPCNQYTNTTDKEVCLLSYLTLISSITRKYSSSYNGNTLYPTLYNFIINNSGGILKPIYSVLGLAQKLDEEEKSIFKYEQRDYPQLLEEYKIDMQQHAKKPLKYPPIKPETPINKQFLVPIHLHYTSLIHILATRGGKALLHQVDDDNKIAQPTAKLIHKGYYNLPFEHFMIATQNNLAIPQLQLSILQSGDYNSLLNTVPNIENVLYPCINYYIVDKKSSFNPFQETTTTKEVVKNYYDKLGDFSDNLSFGEEYTFVMQEEEQACFIAQFGNGNYTPQQATTCYRIAMLLCILNEYDRTRLINNSCPLYCTNTELQQAIAVTDLLHTHQHRVANYLRENGKEEVPITSSSTPALTEEQLLVSQLHEQGMSLRKIAQEVYEDEGKFMKVKRILENIESMAA